MDVHDREYQPKEDVDETGNHRPALHYSRNKVYNACNNGHDQKYRSPFFQIICGFLPVASPDSLCRCDKLQQRKQGVDCGQCNDDPSLALCCFDCTVT